MRIPGGDHRSIIGRYLSTKWTQFAFIEERLAPSDLFKGGRPPIDRKLSLEAIMWVCISRCGWLSLPEVYPNGKSLHRTFRHWQRIGLWDEILWTLATNTPTGTSLKLGKLFDGKKLIRPLHLHEFMNLVQYNYKDRNTFWFLLLFLSPNGTDRRQRRRSGTP